MTIFPDEYEIGSAGYMWKNLLPNSLLNSIRLHVYYAHHMHTDIKWAGNQFTNHYNRIYFVESGNAVLQFDDSELEMRPGHIYLIPPYTLKSHYSRGDLHFYWAHFHAFIDGDLDFIALFGKPEEFQVKFPEHVIKVFDQLVMSVNNAEESEILQRNMLISQLIHPFLSSMLKRKEQLTHCDHARFFPILTFIEKNLNTQISITKLANSVGVSTEHFSRSFKEIFKITPKRYIQKKRMGLAKQLLLLGKQPINDIAMECGFCDQYYFSKSFKQEEGCSPTHYRKKFVTSTVPSLTTPPSTAIPTVSLFP